MPTLAQLVDGVIGVDSHRDTLAAAALNPVGGLLGQTAARADTAGYQALLGFARSQVPGRRCWAIEGAGSYGAGLVAFLGANGEQLVEPPDPSDRPGAPGPRPTPSTPSGLPVMPSARSLTSWQHPASAATGRRCGCC
jgi:hypothetical protein